VKEGLRELYEKAKREQWNATVELAWETSVDPESEIIPDAMNPLQDFAPYQKGFVRADYASICAF